MAGRNGKEPEAELTSDGIKVAISEEEWIVYEKDGWLIDHEFLFQHASDIDAMRLLIERAKDWHIRNGAGAYIPFNKVELLATLENIKQGKPVPFIGIPVQLQVPLSNSFYFALREARRLPLPLPSKSG